MRQNSIVSTTRYLYQTILGIALFKLGLPLHTVQLLFYCFIYFIKVKNFDFTNLSGPRNNLGYLAVVGMGATMD